MNIARANNGTALKTYESAYIQSPPTDNGCEHRGLQWSEHGYLICPCGMKMTTNDVIVMIWRVLASLPEPTQILEAIERVLNGTVIPTGEHLPAPRAVEI